MDQLRLRLLEKYPLGLAERRRGSSISMNRPRLVGPSVAGTLIASVGEGMRFLFNPASYVAVIAALLTMIIAPRFASRRNFASGLVAFMMSSLRGCLKSL
jgi:Transmembrane secretion effector